MKTSFGDVRIPVENLVAYTVSAGGAKPRV